MIRYAIISDIHGNLEALNAVINDMKEQNIDRVICLGDIISKGSHGHECISKVRKMCDAVVRGNNDIKYAMSLDEIASEEVFDYDEFLWTQKQLSNDDINYIRSLPMCCEFNLSGRLVRCFHAGPENVDKSLFNFDKYDDKLSMFKPSEFTTQSVADVVVYGHSHFAGFEKLFGYTLINAGSVGNSLNILSKDAINSPKMGEFTQAEYLILSGEDGLEVGELSIEFRQVNYDKSKELESFSYAPHKKVYEMELRLGVYRYMDRVEESLRKNGIDEV